MNTSLWTTSFTYRMCFFDSIALGTISCGIFLNLFRFEFVFTASDTSNWFRSDIHFECLSGGDLAASSLDFCFRFRTRLRFFFSSDRKASGSSTDIWGASLHRPTLRFLFDEVDEAATATLMLSSAGDLFTFVINRLELALSMLKLEDFFALVKEWALQNRANVVNYSTKFFLKWGRLTYTTVSDCNSMDISSLDGNQKPSKVVK